MEAIVENPGYCPCCRSATTFRAEDPWLRDAYVCLGCGSIPRQRHLQAVLDQFFPAWEHLVLHESSPSNDFLANRCMHYSSSQYLPGVALGSHHHGVRCESIEELTFADESIDIFVSQDVLEHVFHPERAIREIARVLRPGGAHVFTVPVHPGLASTVRRAVLRDGEIEHLHPEEYHGSPVGDHRALVTFDYGRDFPAQVSAWADGASVEVIHTLDRSRGLEAEHLEVYVVRKPLGRSTSATPGQGGIWRPSAPRSVVEGRSTARVSLERLQTPGKSRRDEGAIVGFGDGPSVRAICESAPRHRVVHIDPTHTGTATADSALPPGITRVPAVLPTPLGAGTASLVVSGDAFQHLTSADQEKWAAEIARLLGSDGVLTLEAAGDSRPAVEAAWGRVGLSVVEWVPPHVLSRQAFVVLRARRPRLRSALEAGVPRARRLAGRAKAAVAQRIRGA
ncbi:MAG TPA: methyltransferase domain-containing protein [Dermatophilaceae bacterium]|nr:methyltransferase domain-containing protein [Dermatophilaceae bacterium]